MRLADVLRDTNSLSVLGSSTIEVTDVTEDSRAVSSGSLYAAIKGTQFDGHRFIPNALAAGAVAIVCEDIPRLTPQSATFVVVPNSGRALGEIASAFYGHPSRKMRVVGVTGTNGKTTTATLLYLIATHAGIRAGLLSTIDNIIGDRPAAATHTTPDPVTLQRTLRAMLDDGCSCVFMEVSSHAVVQHRVAGLNFAGGVFTNLTHDHLDYHGTMEEYFLAKRSFFDGLSRDAFALTNADDPHGQRIVGRAIAAVHSYGIRTEASFRGVITSNDIDGIQVRVRDCQIKSHLVGRFNAYNLLASFSCASLLGFSDRIILKALEGARPIRGRFDWVRASNGCVGVVDFAHTPDGLENLVRAARDVFPGRRLTLVMGCGGDRDRDKRPVMGRIGSSAADSMIVTSDNPRSENEQVIIEEILAGVPPHLMQRVVAIPDRRKAIEIACTNARPDGVVLVAGKGHEEYQEVRGEKIPFSDKVVLQQFLSSSM